MTTDIKELVKRLRVHFRSVNASGLPCMTPRNPDGEEAALALEALAGERNTATANLKGLQQQVRDLVAERDRLKEAIERNAQNCIDTMNKMHEQHAAERDCLKAALASFAAIKADDGDDFSTYDDQVVIRCEVTAGDLRKARTALGEAS